MKMKNKGFTLIELLAVMTILAIILTITVISISSTVSDSKTNLRKDQISQIEKAAEYYNNKEGLSDYTLCVGLDYLTENGYLKDDIIIDPKTGKKMSGSVRISYDGKKYAYKYEEGVCLCKSVNGKLSTELGTKYKCYVNDTDLYNFYVLSTENNGKTINLIMDRDMCGDSQAQDTCFSPWSDSSFERYSSLNLHPDINLEYGAIEYGPILALYDLYLRTKNWNNVPDMIMKYRDENEDLDKGYVGITTNESTKETMITGYITRVKTTETGTIRNKEEIVTATIGTKESPLKARLPMLKEVLALGCKVASDSLEDATCPSWMFENSVANNGYWLLSTQGPNASIVTHFGSLGSGTDHDTYNTRPVITVSINNLSS